MKTLLTCAMIAMFGAALAGCDSTTDNGSKHETVQDKKVTDANGNVISETHTKSDQTSNNP